ncbi:MAG: ankyrin repeat domain-containing protein, partial [Lachnospiraceae bacterium]|nr:ankyrin repeat domain-containing protein [Lachnospiraceae bacterium]
MDNIEFADKVSDLIVERNVKEVKDLLKDKFSDTKELNEMAKLGWWLKQAVGYQQMEIVEFLIELGVDVNMVVLPNKGNVLCDAAGTGNMKMIEFLIEKGIDISCTLDDELNPVLCAVCSDWLEVVKYLLEKEKEMLQPLEYEELIKEVIDYADIFASKKVLDYLG